MIRAGRKEDDALVGLDGGTQGRYASSPCSSESGAGSFGGEVMREWITLSYITSGTNN